MSDVRDPRFDQPLPKINENPSIQDMVIQDIEERKRIGLAKYGTLLQAGNGRDMLQDAYDEVIDLAIYLRGEIEERRKNEEVTITQRVLALAEELYNQAVEEYIGLEKAIFGDSDVNITSWPHVDNDIQLKYIAKATSIIQGESS